MRILLNRIYFRDGYTVGCLKIQEKNGQWRWFCDTIEPHAIPWYDDPLIGQQAGVKEAGKTAIPEGTYSVELEESLTYKREMPVLKEVPQFPTIYLRTGKSPEKTRGDILVGQLVPNEGGHPSDDPNLEHSLKTFKKLFKLMHDAQERQESVTVIVRSRYGWMAPKEDL